MAAKSPDDFNALIKLLAQKPRTAAAICAEMGITQSTFSRLWRRPDSPIISLGSARATVYAIGRTILGLEAILPVYRIAADGKYAKFGELRALAAHWYVFTCQDGKPQFSEGLHYFLQDMRPQGFLGRLVPQQNQDLKLPEKITEWTDDQVLFFLARRGDDSCGNLLIGDEALMRFILRSRGQSDVIETAIPLDSRQDLYPQLAQAATRGEATGSSAGGEQPKFTARLVEQLPAASSQVIVKFSPPLDSKAGRRWGDLLLAEHLAAETLSEFGIAGCESNIVISDARVFLEVHRFDRIGERGRAPMVSFAGLDSLIGRLDLTWSNIALRLFDRGMLPKSEREKIQVADLFGGLIGNTDRHPGNIACSWDEQNKLALLPIYDMLPMLYRPNNQGEVVERVFSIDGLALQNLQHLPTALRMAEVFWRRVMLRAEISADFKELAVRHCDELAKLRDS